jgi:putative addiction module component (TIGR02574 family)
MKDLEPKLLEEALRLPAEARAALAGTLLESLDEKRGEDAEAAWAEEISRRVQAIDSGKTKLVPWAEARKRILAR